MIDICCIIINYNTSSYSLDCVKSILKNTNANNTFEIIVVDNASKQDDWESLDQGISAINDTRIKLVRSRQNIGFGAGNMLGVQHAIPCLYYAFINNDTLLTAPETLNHLFSFMQSNSQIGVCSPQMVDEHDNFRKTIDHFATLQREILRRKPLEILFPKTYLNRKKRYHKPTKVHYVQGSFMFVDAKAFNTVGGFDTNLFLYYEESDLCRRLLKTLKLETYLYPDLDYIHFQSKSTKKNMLIKMEQKISLVYYIQKHYGWFQYKVLLVYYGVRYFLKSIISPSYFKLFLLMCSGAPLSKSLKQKQPIQQSN